MHEGDDFNNIEEYWQLIKKMERKNPNSKSLFMNFLDLTEWHCVMIKFIEDINNIIKKISCY